MDSPNPKLHLDGDDVLTVNIKEFSDGTKYTQQDSMAEKTIAQKSSTNALSAQPITMANALK
jgi:hypothetical protein